MPFSAAPTSAAPISAAPNSVAPTAVITGASSGIGAATAHTLAAAGFDVVLGARRLDRLEEVAREIVAAHPGRTATVLELDVTDPESVTAFAAGIESAAVLINNAGGAIGVDPVATADVDDWARMYDMNVLGVLRVTQALLPRLREHAGAEVATLVSIGSIAAHEPYSGGGGYNASKHGIRAVTKVLRIELLGEPIRVTEIDPGMVETEFSINRLGGDVDAAAAVYTGMNPLTAADIADAIGYMVTRPAHVNIDTMLIMPTDQATAKQVHRR